MQSLSSSPAKLSGISKFSLFLVLSLIFSIFAGYGLGQWFRVKTVVTIPDTLSVDASDYYQYNLLMMDNNGLVKKIETEYPLITEVDIDKQWPDTLVIRFRYKKPLAQIKNNGYYLQLDREGTVIRKTEQSAQGLFQINYYQKIRSYEAKSGNRITDPDIHYALGLLARKNKYRIRVEYVEIRKPRQAVLVMDNDVQIILSTKKQIDKNLSLVQNIHKTLNHQGIEPKVVNLLFDKAIVTL